MTINLTVRAEVVDVHSDTPQANDTLFVDTNVWLWQTCGLPPESNPNRARRAEQKLRLYTGYLRSALACGAELKYCGLILSELAHVIEKTEFDGYDLFLLEAIRQTGIRPVQVLTDDMDYATVPNIQLFTGNGLVIRCADEQGKLISRRQ
jgi:hypothetical protein